MSFSNAHRRVEESKSLNNPSIGIAITESTTLYLFCCTSFALLSQTLLYGVAKSKLFSELMAKFLKGQARHMREQHGKSIPIFDLSSCLLPKFHKSAHPKAFEVHTQMKKVSWFSPMLSQLFLMMRFSRRQEEVHQVVRQ